MSGRLRSASGLSPATRAALRVAELDEGVVVEQVTAAVAEDLAYGPDVTSAATVPPEQQVSAVVAARRPGVLAGLPFALVALDLVAGARRWRLLEHRSDGTAVAAGDIVLRVHAATAALLTAERTVLNYLCHLSGIATLTSAWAAALAPVVVRDTRKTIPGLRVAQKYAVRCGGGGNHRMGLGDAALIKDNHIAAAGSVAAAVAAVRASYPGIVLEVECDHIDQVHEAIAAGVDLVLLDNMSVENMRAAVVAADQLGRRGGADPVRFEASGGLSLDGAAAVATTGVDFAAVGALTHSAPALDLGLDIDAVLP